MTAFPDNANFFSRLRTTLSRKQLADLYRALGWQVRKCGWNEYEVRGPGAELVIEAESPVLMHGIVAEAANVEELLAPLKAGGISYQAEYYGPDRELRQAWTG